VLTPWWERGYKNKKLPHNDTLRDPEEFEDKKKEARESLKTTQFHWN
jgi:hypothetical protein